MTRPLRRMLSALRREHAGREETERLASEQAALRRVATLVARAAAPEEIFAAVAEETAQLSEADIAVVLRYETGGAATVLGRWSRSGMPAVTGRRLTVESEGVAVSVRRTGQPAWAARFAGPPGSVSDWLRRAGMRTGSGSPVIVGGRLWGVVVTAAARSGQPEAGHRLAAFTELAAAAIGNAQARAELAASRARIVSAADETRRRIERDLHDGAQQRLVSLALQLRAAQETVPPGLGRLRAELGQVAAGLTGALDELREYARGIHPAILTDGGLAPALKTLARQSPVPVTLGVHLAGRLPEQVEVTAYYVVSEALANAAKHAGASAVHVDADADATGDLIQLAVRDDGGGGADPARGSGLVGLKDRVEAIGGTWRMRSLPGEGTTLLAELPARPGQSPPR
jgi:signal transduction histidine kinase